MPEPHILVLTTSYPSDENDPSSVFIAKLLGAVRKKGYSLKVVAPSDGSFHGRRVIDGIETVRFGYFRPRSLERLTTRGGGIPENLSRSVLARIQLFPMMFVFFLVSLWEARSCDIIYANWVGAGVIGALVNVLTGKPLVVSFRGDDGYLARDRLAWWVCTRLVSERAAVVAPVSGELLNILVDLGVSRDKCRLPRFGVDVKMFHPASNHKPSEDGFRLLFVGSLIPRKGLHDLLAALADPGFEHITLLVVGEGYQGRELKALCEKLGLRIRIHWKGAVSPAEVAGIMRYSDVLCLPSYMEGRPNVVNEAMASGIPVIATRIGGIPDMVVEGETALLFEPGNIEQLRDRIRALLLDSELRKKMGKAGHDFLTESGVSWDATAEDFHVIFSGLIEDREDSPSADS